MEKSPPATSPEEKAQEEQARRRLRVPQWTGFGRKTLWDWLQLLIVPAILIAVTFAWSATQTRSDNKREDRRIAADRAAAEEARQDATLRGYLGEMSGLMLREKLLTSSRGSAVRAVARTITLTAVRRLDGERKVEVVRFLHEAGLLYPPAVVEMTGADLRDADFGNAFLFDADLEGALLTGANLGDAALSAANLSGADLRRARLAGGLLADASLQRARLVGASLEGAELARADLVGADLRRADLHGADLQSADLAGARLEGADLRGANLVGANLGDDPSSEERFPLPSPGLAEGLDLGRYIADLTPKQQKEFLDSQKAFLDSLSREQLSKFNLSPEKLARIRREASGG